MFSILTSVIVVVLVILEPTSTNALLAMGVLLLNDILDKKK